MKFSELKQKDVVNILDGRRLGRAIDIEFSPKDGNVESITVPGPFSISNIFKSSQGYVIPWQRICKIGDDVVLVDLDAAYFRAYEM